MKPTDAPAARNWRRSSGATRRTRRRATACAVLAVAAPGSARRARPLRHGSRDDRAGCASLAVDGARVPVGRRVDRTRTRLRAPAGLWRGAFLCDLALRHRGVRRVAQREQERLAGAAARAFALLCANADASHDGERAIDAAERLVALDPTREDRQRAALKICARYRAATPRSRAPASSRACCATSSRCHPTPRRAPYRIHPQRRDRADAARGAGGRAVQHARQGDISGDGEPRHGGRPRAPVSTPATTARWRRPAMAAALVSAVSIGAVVMLGLATGSPHGLWSTLKPKTRRRRERRRAASRSTRRAARTIRPSPGC